ncbi:UDP-Gal:alpha-D-GlcNAc-diphosphoundecaprenol beta-1,4-galactosyltransferase [Pseudoalteromonas sp. P1-30]|uniref:WecB/TagA/CpsF family glycosyltransferase n=1 Tax=Pseudoalteromonas sp. P1-30 TaxID=1723760 RepID=UPI0006D61308|nr:WecB/TagA/CpsF family glycosyltransferase [Pseudoalteromonas sp. P1-30]KPV91510.1 UDP-Gal:alpha-D-GlcNAc-diphosphoundecaprenol beta-1,4-galactosyltransferase [Pseudoalteromonas sp. P1-30]
MKRISIVKNFELKSVMEKGGDYSFLNLASVGEVLADKKEQNMTYFCDGMLLAGLLSFLNFKRIGRFSFDFTSVADPIFSYAESNNLSLYFVGASVIEIELFVKKIKGRYPNLVIIGYCDGYFMNTDRTTVINEIIHNDINVVVASMGAGVQEGFLIELRGHGFDGVGFTAGGFIRQESNSKNDYYPLWIERLKLRAFYRMYKEPHTVKRYFIGYFINAFKLVYGFFIKSFRVNIIGLSDER